MIPKKMLHWCVFLGICLLLCGTALSVQADIYLYVDSHGVFHFTNSPTSSDYKLYLREHSNLPERKAPTYSADKYDEIISKAAKKHDLAFPLIKALIKVESDFDPRAVSPMGAKGLMQIMPGNVKALRIDDPFDPT